jgi:6-phosphofructokinase 1
MRLAILTSGGDAPGMNAAIHSVVTGSHARGHEILGVRFGYRGLMAGDFCPLGLVDVDEVSRLGGSLLGSARAPAFLEAEGRAQAARQLEAAGIDGLVVIGGNGSLAGAHALAAQTDRGIVGLPASIDNDVGCTLLAIGVDTAVNTIVEACDRIADTARAHRRAFVVEVMGRDCGFLAMRSGIAAEADAILFSEEGLDEDAIVARLRAVLGRCFAPGRGKRRALFIKAEGVKVATDRIVSRLRETLGTDGEDVEIRSIVLGHLVRGGSPSAIDRLIAQRLAFGAVLALEDGARDRMLAWDAPGGAGEPSIDPRVRRVPLADVLEETRRLIDGTSEVTRQRMRLLQLVEPVLAQ